MAISNQNVKRPIVEEGIVLQKFISNERQAGEINGRKYDYKPATPTIRIASSYNLDNDMGLEDFVVLDYEVDEATFKKLHFMSKVRVKYTHSSTVRDGKQVDIFADRQIMNVLPNN